MNKYSREIPKISFLYESWGEVRRLGIMREIINIIGRHGYIPERKLVENFLEKKDELNKAIDNYDKDPTGHITLEHWAPTQRGTIKNYLTMSRLLDLTRLIVTRWILSDYGKLIFSLPRERNPMNLTMMEKIAFLKKILEKDSDYFLTILQVIKDHPESIFTEFKVRLVNFYETLMKDSRMARLRSHFRQCRSIVESWSDSRIKHMTSMRIAWAIDLDLCKKTAKGFQLSKAGYNLIRFTPKKVVSNSVFLYQCDTKFLEENYFHTIKKCYEIKAVEGEITNTELLSYIYNNFYRYTPKRLKMKKVSDIPILERMILDFLTSDKYPKIILEISYLREKLQELTKENENIYFVWDRRRRKGWIVLR